MANIIESYWSRCKKLWLHPVFFLKRVWGSSSSFKGSSGLFDRFLGSSVSHPLLGLSWLLFLLIGFIRVFSPASSFACGFSSLCHRTNRHQLPGHQPNLRSSGPDNGLQGIGPCMSDNPLDQVSDLVRALNTLSLALENNPQQRAPAAASAAPAGSSPAREDSFELITEEPSPSQVQGIRTQPVQIAYNNNSFAETIPPVPHWILRDCQSLVAGELGKQAFEQPPLCKAESGHLEHLRAFHFVQRSTSSFEHLDWKHQQECQTLRIFTGSQDAWKEATWCATLSHHCLKPRPIVKEPDSASLHNINGADPKKVPGRSADDQDHSIYMQAAIVLFREGEALLALPGLAISDEVLDSYAAMIDPAWSGGIGRPILPSSLPTDGPRSGFGAGYSSGGPPSGHGLGSDRDPVDGLSASSRSTPGSRSLRRRTASCHPDTLSSAGSGPRLGCSSRRTGEAGLPHGPTKSGTCHPWRYPATWHFAQRQAARAKKSCSQESITAESGRDLVGGFANPDSTVGSRQEAFEQNMAGAQPSVPRRPPSTGSVKRHCSQALLLR